MKDVIIDIVGTVHSEGEPEVIELTTVGKMANKNGKWYVLYDENSTDGMEGMKTTLKVENENLIIMQRSGNHRSRLTVERGQRHMCHYCTDYGEVMIGIFGEAVDAKLTENGGELYMRYTIDINAGFSSKNEVSVKIREANNNHVTDH